MTSSFDLSGTLRRIRRIADLSQRELADACGVSQSAVARAEAGTREVTVAFMARAGALAGLRLALLDAEGREVSAMAADRARDGAWRRFPAHLDTRHSDERWWHGPERYSRRQPSFTFDRDRETRDAFREVGGIPADHHIPQPGDSPQERRAAQQRAAREERRRRLQEMREAGELQEAAPFSCACPPACDELDDWSGKPVHAADCPCGCDVG